MPELNELRMFKGRTDNVREHLSGRSEKVKAAGRQTNELEAAPPTPVPTVATYDKNYPGGWPELVGEMQRAGYVSRGSPRKYRTHKATPEIMYEVLDHFMRERAEQEVAAERERHQSAPEFNPNHVTWESKADWPSFTELERAELQSSAYTMRRQAENNPWDGFIRDAGRYVLERSGQTLPDHRRL